MRVLNILGWIRESLHILRTVVELPFFIENIMGNPCKFSIGKKLAIIMLIIFHISHNLIVQDEF